MKKLFIFASPLLGLLLGAFIGPNRQPSGPDGKIHVVNPSFEGERGDSKSPPGWMSSTPGSTPDLFPGAWGLDFAPYDAATCLGLVTREDGTSEDVGQLLTETLKGGTCYTFSLYLSHAAKYVGYNRPTRLRIWGGSKKGKKEILLASSPLIDHAEWKPYKFQFVPTKDIRFIVLEAYFAPGALFHYKGNILLDLCSPIERCDRA